MGVFLYQYSLFITLLLLPFALISLKFLGKKGVALILSVIFFFLGGFYTDFTEKRNISKAEPLTLSEKIHTGTVITVPESESYGQSAVVECDGVRIFLMTRESKLNYKDYISFKGICSFPDSKSRPFAFNYSAYLKTDGVYVTTFGTDITVHRNLFSKFNPLDIITAARIKALNVADRLWSGEALMFARAILLGDSSYSSAAFRDKLSEGSISHIIAVSGTHVSLISLAFIFLVRKFSIRNRKYYFAILPVIIFFVLFAGHSPSAWRAAIMLILYIFATVTLSHFDGFTSLSVAAFILLAANPFTAFSLSFILSFSAIAGIMLFGKPFSEALNFIRPKALRASLSVTLSAQIFTIPTLSISFGRFPFLALLANLIAVPLVPFIMLSGYLALIFSFVPDSLNIFADMFNILSFLCIKTAELSAKLPLSNIYPVFQSKILYISCFALLFCFLIIFFIYKKKKTGAVFLALTVIAFTANFCYPHINGEKSVYFIDSEHGDCTAILNGPHIVLADCFSPDSNFLKYSLIPFLRQKGFYSLDAVLLSEYNKYDETLSELFTTVEVKQIFMPESSDAENLKKLLPNTGITFVSEGNHYNINGIEIFIPHKTKNICSYQIVNSDTTILLPGNIEAKTEEALSSAVSDVDILKAPRHGNKGSCSDALLEASTPESIIVSTGRKLSDDFSERLKNYPVYSTKTGGDITVNCKTKEITSYKKVK